MCHATVRYVLFCTTTVYICSTIMYVLCVCVCVCCVVLCCVVCYWQTWKGSWSGHTVAVRRLKIKGDVYKTGLLESFPIEYMKLRYNVHKILQVIHIQ